MPSRVKTRNRRLADVVAAGHAGLRLAGIDPLARGLLLVRSQDSLAADLRDWLRRGAIEAAKGTRMSPLSPKARRKTTAGP